MGYYMDFKVEVAYGDLSNSDFTRQASNIAQYDIALSNIFSAKWCDHEKDMKEISKSFPDVLFQLEGHGEDLDDLWVKYFKNGMMQVCKAQIIFEDYDPRKMKL